MEYVCDAPGDMTWFRIVTEGEAVAESEAMRHAVEKYFRREREKAEASYKPPTTVFIEQAIGLQDYVRRSMPFFLTLRDTDGHPHVTAMLPPGGKPDRSFSAILVGAGNADPYPAYGKAIQALADHFGLSLDRARCYPYRR